MLALESTTDLHTIRAALAAPVKGLGVAFGTSVAGVATSAMLGLVSALCRRERQKVGQWLDSRIAGVLRDFSLPHQRQETFKALQAQSQALPELVGKLDTLLNRMSEQQQQLGERLLSGQERFHAEAKTLYTDLAQSVDQSLKTSLRDSASVAAETIQPVVTATLGRIADENQRLHERLFGSVHGQLSEVAGHFAHTAGELGGQWQAVLAQQQQLAASQRESSEATLAAYAERFEQRAETLLAAFAASQEKLQAAATSEQGRLLATAGEQQRQLAAALNGQVEQLNARLDTAVTQVAASWQTAQAAHAEDNTRNRAQLAGTLEAFAERFDERAHHLLDTVADGHGKLQAQLAASHAAFAQTAQAHQASLAERLAGQLDGIGERFAATADQVSATWNAALGKHEQASERLTQALDRTQESLAASFSERSAALLGELRAAQAAWQQDWAAGEAARQQQASAALEALAGTLERQWQGHGEAALAQQQQLTQTLGATAQQLIAATRAQSETTIGEVTRLMQTAAEAPKAAAEVIGQLRQELSASIARDNSLLAERTRIMETLSGLLDAINHASTEQRSAIDALVASAAGLLERSGRQFVEQVGNEAGKLVEIGAGIAGGALEVASLGAAFGSAVDLFAESNDKMMATLQRIEGTLAKSLTRSDEQLAYYVAQAREIIDLSILSQKKMVDDLQRVAAAGSNAALAAEA